MAHTKLTIRYLTWQFIYIGSALEGGHYIAYVMVNGHWFEMNDKQVYNYIQN